MLRRLRDATGLYPIYERNSSSSRTALATFEVSASLIIRMADPVYAVCRCL